MSAKMTRPLYRARRQQRGFTLVELSIAVLIGLFLLGGLLTLVQDMRRTFGAQNQLGQLQDSERLAMTLIADVVQAAGYYPDPTQQIPTLIFPGNAPFVSVAAQTIAGTGNLVAPGDSISVRYLTAPNDGVINCVGGTNTFGVPTIFINTFRVVANATQDLQCTFNGGKPVTLVSGVKNLQILYGIKRLPIGVGATNNVDTFATWGQMVGPDWGHVICVKVTLTFTNPLAAQAGQPPTIAFTRVVNVMNRAGVNTT
jgi:type IV pilus assembly protein PilW